MLIERVEFKNFRSLRDTVLPLGQLTVLVGPNGSGKTTALQGLLAFANPNVFHGRRLVSVSAGSGEAATITLTLAGKAETPSILFRQSNGVIVNSVPKETSEISPLLSRPVLLSFEIGALSSASALAPNTFMGGDGSNLASELDQLRDASPERFEALNEELHRWLPEFDRVLFDTPTVGIRAIKLRTSEGGDTIPASDLSFGTLAALAFLTLAYRLTPPPFICFEEPDRGVHPRLLPRLQEALYRLAYPASFGETREPTQIIVTTHSPYFLDLFKDHPEEVVVAEKVGNSTTFKRLIELPNAEEILDGSPLGEVWFSGILGGVPAA